ETTGKAYADKEQAKKAARQNMKWHEQLISHFAEIFFPLLPALCKPGAFHAVFFGRCAFNKSHKRWPPVFVWLLNCHLINKEINH
ncbi:hypothetical protein MJL27_27075, partial [Salmonella enterica subsp. enterica serovar Anatum]|nr:hypothetical protein [Salmonella enterica subsp. enterica serovar Anatum]